MRLALGSVQFGLNYGVSNQQGKPKLKEVEKILKLAVDNQIDVIDTACAYGNSEQVLGKFNAITKYCRIVTKLPPFNREEFTQDDCEYYLALLRKRLADLNTDNLYGVMLHAARDIKKEGATNLCQALNKLKIENIVQKTGLSLYSHGNFDDLLKHEFIDLIQIPFNCFDTFFKDSGYIERFKKNQVEIHARSCFLQGLLLMQPEDLPSYFSPRHKQLKEFTHIAQHHSISKLELAILYTLNEPLIDKIVIGVNSEQQLEEILEAYSKMTDTGICDLPVLSSKEQALTNPAQWKL